MPAIVVGLLILALWLGEIVYELSTGKLLARGWKVYARREDNPMLYWSSMALKILVALFITCVVVIILVKEVSKP